MQPMTEETFGRIMSGNQDWQLAIQGYEADKADGTLTWDENGKPSVPVPSSLGAHIKAHTRPMAQDSWHTALCASAMEDIHRP